VADGVALHGVSLAQFEGDKIVTERVYFDRQNLFEQLGLIGKSARLRLEVRELTVIYM